MALNWSDLTLNFPEPQTIKPGKEYKKTKGGLGEVVPEDPQRLPSKASNPKQKWPRFFFKGLGTNRTTAEQQEPLHPPPKKYTMNHPTTTPQ